ncbi:MAG: CGLD27 family protein, partial [Rhodobacteraceae bacterium]|nr:CGLD27 family protein [Paracoccaceae bacterium]
GRCSSRRCSDARSGRRLGWLGLAFFLVLAPSSGMFPLADHLVEHRMYLPLLACVVFCVLAAERLLARLARDVRTDGSPRRLSCSARRSA